MTQAELDKIETWLSQGRTVYICNYLRAIKITPKNWWAWKQSGRPLLKVCDSGLLIARGRGYDLAPDGTFTIHVR